MAKQKNIPDLTQAATEPHAIVLHSVVPLRREPSETSEQTTQLLFAETCRIIGERPRWVCVRNDADGQTGWADSKMITPMSDTEYEAHKGALGTARVSMPMVYAVSEGNGQTIPLSAGTRLPNYSDGRFAVLGSGFRIDSSMVAPKPLEMNEENLRQVLRFFLNTPYLWGGKNCMGMDCSGFVQVVLSLFGRDLPRDASEQVLQGTEVGFLAESQCGDLVFFDHHNCPSSGTEPSPSDTRISHVGILLSPDTVVHCSGRVKVERIDANGIISTTVSSPSAATSAPYSHDLRTIRRY